MTAWKGLLTAAALLMIAAILTGCEKTDPTAPESSTMDLSANPASIDLTDSETGTSTLSALVLNEDGVPVPNIKVFFSTTAGTLRSNGNGIATDSNGLSRDVLTLRRGEADATVKARASGAGEETLTVGTIEPGGNQSPVAVPRSSATSAKTGQNITFNGTESTDADGTVVTWKWTFNFPLVGGGSDTDIVQGDAAAASIVTRSFPAGGTVTVRLQVTDDDGALSANASLSPDITIVSNYAPTAVVTGPTSVTVLTPFSLDGSASHDDPRDTGGIIKRYDWNMGDGFLYTNQTSPTITHTYLTIGAKTVTLKVYDNGDGTNCNATTNLCNDSQNATTTHTINVQ